jgi:DNA gyrase subunit B
MKILNVEKASIDKVLANAEIKSMINAFGCGFSEGFGNDFDIEKLRYDKIVIMADADIDGEHIATLLLTLFYRFMPELITNHKVYVACPPLYKVLSNKKNAEPVYLYNDEELEAYKQKNGENFGLQRYKGLGEMNPDQLWETTMNPDTRLLKLVDVESMTSAGKMTALLMGNDVEPRKMWIQDNAQYAELDI